MKLMHITCKKDAEKIIEQLLKMDENAENFQKGIYIHGYYGLRNRLERGYWTIKQSKSRLFYSWKEDFSYSEGLEIDRKDAINHLWSKRHDFNAWIEEDRQ